eukprot:Em0001g3322a
MEKIKWIPIQLDDTFADSKCDYPSVCKVMKILLLQSRQMAIYLGPRLSTFLPVGSPASSLYKEYSGLECTVEVVKGVEDAVNHINTYGSAHTDTIVTENAE